MSHPEKKKQRLEGRQCNNDETTVVGNDFLASIESLSGDAIANIFGFLLPQEIMHARLNRKMREAAKEAIVPLTDFIVNNLVKYNAMSVMAIALPNLQKITLGYLGDGHKFVDGEDPDEEWDVETAGDTTHDIGIIANFTKLRELEVGWMFDSSAPLNGRYPCFFNFPYLQKLSIIKTALLKFDLDMLGGLPSLKVFDCEFQKYLTGNINSLRVLKDTLEKLRILQSGLVKGNFMDLADFQHLKEVDLRFTAVTGDIRDVSEKDFPSLTVLALPAGVYGGAGYELQRISDATDFARIPYLFLKQRPEVMLKRWYARLSVDSPDMYEVEEIKAWYAPIEIRLVKAGSRVGYRWENGGGYPCEVNWLDPEPDKDSAGYGEYKEELQEIERQVNYFKGFHQPPAQEEFEMIFERIHEDNPNPIFSV